MKLVPLDEMTPEQWYRAWSTMFNPQVAEHVGVNPAIIAARPSLEDFYQNVMAVHRAGTFEAWAILRGEEFRGYTLLDKSAVGEWEIVTVLTDPADWGSGLGARATIKAVKWAFEVADSEWVVAFTQGRDPRVHENLVRGGFRPFANLLVLDRQTWDARWRARSNR